MAVICDHCKRSSNSFSELFATSLTGRPTLLILVMCSHQWDN